MARQTLTPVSVVGPYPALPVSANSLDVAFVAADASNKEQFALSGGEIILAWNTGASSRTFTVTSVADAHRRSGDVDAYSLGAGEIAAFKVAMDGWRQSDGNCYLEASHAEVKFAILRA